MAITNLAGTKWYFNASVDTTTGLGTYNINFTSNGQNFVQIYTTYRGYTPIDYIDSAGNTINAYNNSAWTNEAYRTIEISGGADVEDGNLIAFLQVAAVQEITEPPTFNETKTALKIYEGLIAGEYAMLTKEDHSFYIVDNVGIYKGETLISTKIDIDVVNNLNANVSSLQASKQDVLESGIDIKTINGESVLGSGNIVIKSDKSLNLNDATAIELTASNLYDLPYGTIIYLNRNSTYLSNAAEGFYVIIGLYGGGDLYIAPLTPCMIDGKIIIKGVKKGGKNNFVFTLSDGTTSTLEFTDIFSLYAFVD